MAPSNDDGCARVAWILSQLGPRVLEAERRYREVNTLEPTSVTRQMANDALERYNCWLDFLGWLAEAEAEAARHSGNGHITTVSRVFVSSDGNRQSISLSWRCRSAKSAIAGRRTKRMLRKDAKHVHIHQTP